MNVHRTRFAVMLSGDRLCAAVVHGSRLHTFVVESDQPAAALRAELDARKLAPSTVAIGLPRAIVTVKPIELPAITGDARQMIQFELERHLPFPTDDAAFDFVPLPKGDQGDEPADAARRVLVAAADRRVVDTALRIVQEAKLRASSVSVGAHDLVALVRIPPRARVVWLHRVDDVVDALFVARDGVVLSRTLPALDEVALVTELRRSFALAKWRRCDAVWVSGDMAAPAAPSDSPLAQLGAPITAPPYTVAARRLLGSIESGPRGALELATAVALAPADRPLDLLPPALRPFRLTRGQLITSAVAAATVVLALMALVAPGYRDGRRLATVTTEIAKLDGEVRAVERMVKELETKRKLLATVQALEAGALYPLPVLRELTELLPNDAWLTLLSLDAKGVELTGQANTASALIPLLENSPRLERVEFASPVTRGRDREQFRIQAAWEARGAQAAATPAGAPDGRRPGVPPAARPQPPAASGAPAVSGAPVAPGALVAPGVPIAPGAPSAPPAGSPQLAPPPAGGLSGMPPAPSAPPAAGPGAPRPAPSEGRR